MLPFSRKQLGLLQVEYETLATPDNFNVIVATEIF